MGFHNLFQITNKQLGVGPRIVKQIDMYIKNLPNMSSITRGDAFDIQIVQRILTKIRGTGEQLKNLLIEQIQKKRVELLNYLISMNMFRDFIRVEKL